MSKSRWVLLITRHWWQAIFPRYGNWGGPGWSAGMYNNDPALTDWSVPGIDAMDNLYKVHDRAYQSGQSWLYADTDLLRGLCHVRPSGLYGRCYRVWAILLFGMLSCVWAVTGDNSAQKTP